MVSRNPYFRLVFPLVILAVWIGSAAAAPDVGMITRLAGSVSCRQQDAQNQIPAKSFMKVYQNDQLILDEDSEVQLVYFGSGRKETWSGPLVLKVDKEGGVSYGGESAKKPEISEVPMMVAKEFSRISNQIHRSGSALVRGGDGSAVSAVPPIPLSEEEQKTIDFARKVYDDMRKSTAPEDITPELYLYSFLADYDLYSDMAKLLAIMKKKQPSNTEIETLAQLLPANYRP